MGVRRRPPPPRYPCATPDEWAAWWEKNAVAGSHLAASFCADCRARFRAEMREKGRCQPTDRDTPPEYHRSVSAADPFPIPPAGEQA